MRIIVTGSTGRIGAPVYAALRDSGYDVVGLNRHGSNGHRPVDLLKDPDLASVFTGTDAVIHCAQQGTKSDVAMALKLARAAKRAHISHLVSISIVGIDSIPLNYYRQRLLVERALMANFPRTTIQRTTQFHSLIDRLFTAQRLTPAVLLPKLPVQPISAYDVAGRLCDLALGSPMGRVQDIGGPQVLGFTELFSQWRKARGSKRRALPVSLPGRAFRAFETGYHLTPDNCWGKETFKEFLARSYG